MIRRRLMRVLFSVVASALLLLALASNAKAADAFTMPSIQVAGFQVSGLGNYLGKYLTIYYADGRRASISTQSDQIDMSEVKAKNTIPIKADVLQTPGVSIPILGFSQYNLVVLVISTTPDFRWVNADGSIPTNEKTTGSTAYDRATSLTFGEALKVRTGLETYQYGQIFKNN